MTMRSLRTLAVPALALGLVLAALVAGAAWATVRPAEATGSSAVAPLPSIVNTRIVRAEATLARMGASADANQLSKVPSRLSNALGQTADAWGAAKYVIRTTPPTPAGDAVDDGNGGAAGAYAGPEDTAFAVLSLQHELIAATATMINKSAAKTASLRKSWFKTIVSAQNRRNAAIAFIHKRKPADPTWATVMPGLLPQLNDEAKELSGDVATTKANRTLRKSMLAVRKNALKTRGLIKKYWPPVPAG
jgi:hypothetical protein